jgi:RHS repeat-associated protein
LQTTAPLGDFTYAGLFYNADSGLDLATNRPYDPVSGRWLSRDPLGESSDPVGNLYRYVAGNPISFVDPMGLALEAGPSPVPPPSPTQGSGDCGQEAARRPPIAPCPGLNGIECGAPVPAGGTNPAYPNVCTTCLLRNGLWPTPSAPVPGGLRDELDQK